MDEVEMKAGFLAAAPLIAIMSFAVPAAADSAPAKPAAFAQCAICHKVDKSGTKGLGPNLYGVYGEKAGTKAGFNFSPAMKAWGKPLNDANLNAFLENPMKTVPGTRMGFMGVKDPAKRQAIIDWLKTQK
jgi:cytochrome c